MNLFRRTQRTHQPSVSASRARRPRRQKLGFEPLEDRQLLSLDFPTRANTTTRNAQVGSDNATAANGLSVVVWVDTYSSTDHDIRAQMFNADGTKRGSEISVETNTADQRSAAVAMDANGNFVVVYAEGAADNPFTQNDIIAKRFNNLGVQVGDRIIVANSTKDEFDPDVAMATNGSFVVTDTLQYSGSDDDIEARMYNSSGNFVKQLFFGANSTDMERLASVGMNALGNFDIAWEQELGTEIRVARFSSDGTWLTTNAFSSPGAGVTSPSVSLDNVNNAVVAYGTNSALGGGFHAMARRVFSGGILGPEITVSGNLSNPFPDPEVAVNPNTGAYVVAYNVATSGPTRAQVTEVNANNTIASRSDLINVQGSPAVSSDPNGNYLLSYTEVFSNGDKDIFAQPGHMPSAPAAKNLALTPTIQPGQSATLTGQLRDADGDTNLTLTVDWGDGSQPQQSKPGLNAFAVTHKYLRPGIYKVHATWTDSTGLSNSRDLFVTVKP
jgi:hypothetical protein